VGCEAIVRGTGKRCGRKTYSDSRFCGYHRRHPDKYGVAERGQELSPFYSTGVRDGMLDLEVAAALRGVDDEIAVLRMLIRAAVQEGDAEGTRKAIETLCRALKVQYALDGRSAEGLASSLARVLDEVGSELSMTL